MSVVSVREEQKWAVEPFEEYQVEDNRRRNLLKTLYANDAAAAANVSGDSSTSLPKRKSMMQRMFFSSKQRSRGKTRGRVRARGRARGRTRQRAYSRSRSRR